MSRLKHAKAVIQSHDRATHGGDLEAVLHNVAEDVVVLAPGMPLVEGKEAFRAFYEQMLEARWDAAHELSGSVEVFDVVVCHGVARGKTIPSDDRATKVANNFLILLRPDERGEFKIWRAAFAASGEG